MFQSLRDIDQDLEQAKDTDDLDTVIEMMKQPDDKMPPEDLFSSIKLVLVCVSESPRH